MRAKEFIIEQKDYVKDFSADHKDWEAREVAGAFIIPDASQNYYRMYRYGILMARSPEPQPDAYDDQTALGDKLIIAPYSDGDIATMQGASKASGHRAIKSHTYSNKSENKDVNQISPVAKYVPTRRPN
jgi:hypothetical protein